MNETSIQRKKETHLRCEHKFIADNLSSESVKTILTSNHFFFREIFYRRVINNIYLDTPNLDFFNQHENGLHSRKKVRIRWYGATFGSIKSPVLEIKSKNNNIGKKEQFPINSFDFSLGFNLKLIKSILQKSELPSAIKDAVSLLKPTLLNSYQRSYFQSSNKKFRITIDDKLCFKSLYQSSCIVSTKMPGLATYKVIELKHALADESEVNQAANQIPFPLVSNSKYCYGVRSFVL